MYQCLECGKDVTLDLKKARKIQCPFCGYRVLSVKRPALAKRVQSR